MSLKQQAAQLAQDTARQNRSAAQAHEEKMIAAIEDKITAYSGVPARFVDKRSVAFGAYADRRSHFDSLVETVKHEDLYVFAVDDVLVGVKRASGYGYGDPTKYSYDYALVFEDPQRGSYRPEHTGLMWYETRLSKPPAERTADFVATLARYGTPKHPAVKLAEKGETCPSCGRGYDHYEDRY